MIDMEATDMKIAKMRMLKKCCDAIREYMEECDMYDGELSFFMTHNTVQSPDGRMQEGLIIQTSTADFTTNDDAKCIIEEEEDDDEY
jgi:hypothetical protein